MNSARSNRQAGAFTLVEMLVVVGIIALLAALLLPALTAGKMRAKRIVCESQLRQTGIAFQSFAHDHNGKFPMQVSTNDGGSLEFVQSGYLVNGLFYSGFRHFQPLAGTLQTPAILVCPTDTRLPATNFATLQNSNVSYFVGVTADYAQPMSILAGDGNLATASTLVHEITGGRLTWTAELHRFKGNVLFADGHVEEWSDGRGALASGGDFVLPTASGIQSGQFAAANTLGSGSGAANSAVTANHENTPPNLATPPPTPPNLPTTSQPASFPPRHAATSTSSHTATANLFTRTQVAASNVVVEKVTALTNAPGGVVSRTSPSDDDSLMSPFNRQLARFLRDVIVGTYLLILLLFLLLAAYRVWRWMSNPEPQRRRSTKMED